MLRNVIRKIPCHQRIKLASLTCLTALLLAGYLLVFLHLETLIQTKDSGDSGSAVRGRARPSLCKEVHQEESYWKDATAAVLRDLRAQEMNEVGKLLSVLEDKKEFFGGHVDELGSRERDVELMTNRFHEVLGRICHKYTQTAGSADVVGGNSAKLSHDNGGLGWVVEKKKIPIANDNAPEDVKEEILRKVLEDMNSVREKFLGPGDLELKKMRHDSRRRLNIHKQIRGASLPAWKVFHNHISQFSLYEDDAYADDADIGADDYGGRTMLRQLLNDLSTSEITSVDEVSGLGTQLKYIFNFEDGGRALFKPMRTARDSEESLDTYYMYEKERHTSEIAAFHLDRILGFKRVPPVSGRSIDMITDLQLFLNAHSKKKFYLSPVGNQCFFGKCLYYCDPAHGVCGRGRTIEGSFVAFLPNKSLADWSSIKNPWIRSYSKHNRSLWEKEPDGAKICSVVKTHPPFSEWHVLLNVIDIHIFDFLLGNKDRHHFHFFAKFGNSSNFALIDNGKGFGRYTHDIIDILAPLYQCCVIRFSTLKTLFRLHGSPDKKLSRLMKESLSGDALSDILTPAHLRALDRRVTIVLQQVLDCISKAGGAEKVVVDDDVLAMAAVNSS